jgi:hypothetical protein
MTYRRRNLLHRSKLNDFLQWCRQHQVTVRFPPHAYQVAALTQGMEVSIIYDRDHGDHFTTYGFGTQLVERWLKERNECKTS